MNPIGMHKRDLETPALLLDIEAAERNLQRMLRFLNERGVRLRPHVKLHKATPALAHMQMDAGAIGMTCAKVSEAEVLVKAGIRDILIANQIIGGVKIERLIALARIADVKSAVDSPEGVMALSAAAARAGVTLGVLIEVNIGHNRCGVAPFAPALDLARQIIAAPGLELRGIMGYDGHCTLKVTESEREGLSRAANALLAEARRYLEAHGVPIEIVSASGTFTYRFAADTPGITEVQAGTYLLMDTGFYDHGVREFEPALTVLTTVISRPTYPGANGLAVIDTGAKSVSLALGAPAVRHPAGVTFVSLSDQHGRVRAGEDAPLPIGDKVELWVRDANGTINHFNRFYVVRGDHVEAVWEIPLCGDST